MKKKQIKEDYAKTLKDTFSYIVLKKFIDRKGFYKLYKELKNKKLLLI